MTKVEGKASRIDLKGLLAEDADLLRTLMRTALQEVLEAEMADAVGAAKGERTPARLGYRSGYYPRTLITRVGKLELRVPQDREGRFSTELFERYQRSEKALVAALAEMYVQGYRRARSRRSPRSCAVMRFRHRRYRRSTRRSMTACVSLPSGGWTSPIHISFLMPATSGFVRLG